MKTKIKTIILLIVLLINISCNLLDPDRKNVNKWFESNLKDPHSVEIIEWKKIMPENTTEHFSVKYAILCKYRAKNSFGGYDIDKDLFVFDSDNNISQSISMDDPDLVIYADLLEKRGGTYLESFIIKANLQELNKLKRLLE